MIEFDPRIPQNIFVLDRQETIQGYYAAYGDEIARQYESNSIVVIPHFPLQFDLALFQAIEMPVIAKKFGGPEGLEKPVLLRHEGATSFVVDQEHILFKLTGDPNFAIYLQNQIMLANWQIRLALRRLLPRYMSMIEGNITWRLVPTQDEGMHLDSFKGGIPLGEADRTKHRIKLFINIDSEPRQWRTSQDLPGILTQTAGGLPPVMPLNINVVNNIINRAGVLNHLPSHALSYPTLSAVLANGELLAHQVVYGRRMVAAEFVCDYREMLDCRKHPFEQLGNWFAAAGIKAAADPYDPRLPSDWLREAGIKEAGAAY